MDHITAEALSLTLATAAVAFGVDPYVYVVGGAVRNHIMGVAIKDIDVVIDSVAAGMNSGEFATKFARRTGVPFSLVTNQYGVAILTLKGDMVGHGGVVIPAGTVIEVADARSESYGGKTGKGYKPSEVRPASIGDDVNRREFRFNTLLMSMTALHAAGGFNGCEVIDITGHGIADIHNRVIACPTDPDRTFGDDPTRMLRAVKFALRYGMVPSDETLQAIRRNAESLSSMPWEAVGTLFVGDVLRSPKSYTGMVLLDDWGLLAVLREMYETNKAFAAFLSRSLDDEGISLLTLGYLHRHGMAGRVLSHLSPENGAHMLRTAQNLGDEGWAYVRATQSPKLDRETLFAEFGLEGRERAKVTTLARECILREPHFSLNPTTLTEAVRKLLTGP